MSGTSRYRTAVLVVLPILASLLLFVFPGAAWANSLKLVQTVPTGRTPFSVASGDINGDGLTDIVVGNFNSGSATIFYQVPWGGFSTTHTTTLVLPIGGNCASVAIGDVDGDGSPDVVLTETVYQMVWLYRQTAPGVFTAPTLSFDVNGNWTSDQGFPLHPHTSWLMSVQDTVTTVIDSHPWGNGYSMQVADLNGDGAAEIIAPVAWVVDGKEEHDQGGLIIATWGQGRDEAPGDPVVTRLRNWFDPTVNQVVPGMFGTDVYPATIAKDFGPRNPTPACLGDFNNDGFTDILLSGLSGATNFDKGPRLITTIKTVLCSAKQDFLTGTTAWRAASGDLNGDGLADVVVTGREGTGSWTIVLQDDFGHLGGNPPKATINKSSLSPGGIKIGDINGDGRDDVVMADATWDGNNGAVEVIPQLRDTERLPLEPLGPSRFYAAGRYPEDVAIGDFNLNQDLAAYGQSLNDVVVVNSNNNNLMLFAQVKPQPPGILFGGGLSPARPSPSGSSRSAPSRVSAKATVIWISNTRPTIQLTDPVPADLNGMASYYYVFDQSPATFPTPGGAGVQSVAPGQAIRPSSSLGAGIWYLHVVSVDKDGNVGTDAAHYQLNIDTTPPSVPVPSDGFAGAWSDSAFRNVTWPEVVDSQSGVKDYLWALDSGAETSTVTTPVAVSNLGDGAHVFSVRARDNSNPANISQAGTVIMRVDQFPPTCAIANPAENALVSKNMVVSVTASDTAGISRVEFWLDGVLKATETPAQIPAGTVDADGNPLFIRTIDTSGVRSGMHTLLVRAYDMFGHTKDASRAVNVDNTVPKITGVSLAPNPFFPLKRDGYKDNLYIKFRVSKRATLKLSVENSGGTVLGTGTRVGGPGAITWIWNGRLTTHDSAGKATGIIALKEGSYYIRITATDAAGNSFRTGRYLAKIRKYVIQIISGSRVRLVAH
jgi:hypothetical protein